MSTPGAELLQFVRAAELELLQDEQRWLVEGLWAASGLGVIGGAPKLKKSWLGLELSISVASGTKALGRFDVRQPGPALVYLAEDALPQVRARIDALCRGRGLSIEALDLSVITEPSLRLDRELDLDKLARTLERLRPRLLLLDPLVRLHRLDENSAADVSGLLGALRELQRRYDVAIVLVHHASKRSRAHPGQALRGSGDLHAVGDSYLYLAQQQRGLVLTIEQRSSAAPDPLLLELLTDESQGTARLRVQDLGGRQGTVHPESVEDAILDLLRSDGGPLTRGELRTRLRINNQRLGEALLRMERHRQLRRSREGWSLRDSDNRWSDQMPGETEAGSAGAQPAKG